MSLYIGNTNRGGILHVTKDFRSPVELSGDPIDSTVFHSSLPYLDLVTSEDVVINRDIAYDGYSINGVGSSYTGLFTATIPEALFNYFNDAYLIMIECKSRNSAYSKFVVRRTAITYYNDSYYNSYSRYSTGARTFTDSTSVPIGGGYYNNPYTNLNKIKTSTSPSSIYKYLILSFFDRGSSLSDAIYLQSSGGSSQIDVTDSIGKIYVFNLKSTRLDPRYTSALSVQLDKSNFILRGDGSQVNLSDYSFVTSQGTNGDINFPIINGNSIVSGLNIYNINKVSATGWDIDFSSLNFSINKLSSVGTSSLITQNISYVKLVSKIDSNIILSHTGDYVSTSVLSYTGEYKFYVIFITFSATMNGITVDLPPHYHLGFINELTSSDIATASVAVTNNQGGKTSRVAKFNSSNSQNLIDLRYSSERVGNVYTISSNISGIASLLVFN